MGRLTFSIRHSADRLFFSTLGGILLPPIYGLFAYVILEALSKMQSSFLETLISSPLFWTYYIYLHYFPPDPQFPLAVGFAFYDPINLLMFAVGNFVLYTVITWLVFSMFVYRGKPFWLLRQLNY